MEFNKIIAISGKPGLYEIISQTKNGVIVRSIEDDKRVPITATHNVSLLENIAIYTYSGEVPLAIVFLNIAKKEDSKESISHKDTKDNLINYFLEVLPDFDQERVYPSNIKKIVQWYNILVKSGFDFSTLEQVENTKNEE